MSDQVIFADFSGAVRVLPPRAPDKDPAIAVVENETFYEIRSALPGIDADDVFVGVDDDILTICAKACARTQRAVGRFFTLDHRVAMVEQSLTLPADVDPRNLTTNFHDGVLSIFLARTPTSNVVPLFFR